MRLLAVFAALLVTGCAGAGGAITPPPGGTPVPASPTAPFATAPAATAPAQSPTSAATGALPTAGSTAAPTGAATAEPSPAATAPAASMAWTQRSPEGEAPAAREDHTWTVDGTGGAAYLFGGRDGGHVWADLWRYDLATDAWTPLQPAGPAPEGRFGHVAAWIDGVGLVIWSGQAGSRFFADLWAYDPAQDSWSELPAAGDVPEARYGSCAALGPDGRLWISHGFTADSGRFSDTRAYDFTAQSWSDVTPAGPRPVERCLHDCLWTPDGRLVVYGGQTTGRPAIGDLWSYSLADGAWTEAPPPQPVERQLYALAQLGDTAFVFGGGDPDGALLGDLWQLDLAELGWSQPSLDGPQPAARSGATLIADAERGRLLMFGGQTADGRADDLWQLDVPTD